MLFTPGYPGFVRGVASAGAAVSSWSPRRWAKCRVTGPPSGENLVLAQGFDQLYGVAIATRDVVVVAEFGTGRVLSIEAGRVEVLATGLCDPIGVAIIPDGRLPRLGSRCRAGGPAQ